ncbi:FkbM family methyltransferase [Coleofasciculus chthonoplastes]|uniref:FkbM family methyltransferase n=1 Tax=Coleofasciculus chthonoplastes TaxID=64178 RepID=UPI0032F26A01
MYKITKKLKSALYLVRNSSNPWSAIYKQTQKNLKQYKITYQQGKNFSYKAKAGFKFICIPESNTSVNLYLQNEWYEDIELKIAGTWLCKNDNCLDLGANIGYCSALFANKVSRQGKIIAVEASPKTSEYLDKAVRLLNLRQVTLEQGCVIERDGFVDFMVSRDGSVDVKQSLRINPKEKEAFQKKTVKAFTINQLIEKHKIFQDVALVKMDIEGAEPLALKGGDLLFDKTSLPLFIIEIYKLGLSRLSFEPKDILNFLPLDLFDIYHVNRSHPNPIPEFEYGVIYPLLNPNTYSYPWHTNIIAIPKVGKYANRKIKIQSYLP